jgi:hypothetical protein
MARDATLSRAKCIDLFVGAAFQPRKTQCSEIAAGKPLPQKNIKAVGFLGRPISALRFPAFN